MITPFTCPICLTKDIYPHLLHIRFGFAWRLSGICFCSSNLCRFWFAAAPHIKMPNRLDTATFKKRNKKTVKKKKKFTSQGNVAQREFLIQFLMMRKKCFSGIFFIFLYFYKYDCQRLFTKLPQADFFLCTILAKWFTCPMIFPCLYVRSI